MKYQRLLHAFKKRMAITLCLKGGQKKQEDISIGRINKEGNSDIIKPGSFSRYCRQRCKSNPLYYTVAALWDEGVTLYYLTTEM